MARILRLLLACGTLVCVLPGIGYSQTKNGVPPFGSATGGPETINLANLNVDINIPIRNKAGRGTNFTYAVNYDSNVWIPVGVSGNQTWQLSSLGWSGLQPAGRSYVLYSVTTNSGQCGYQGQSSYQVWNYSNFSFYDPMSKKI